MKKILLFCLWFISFGAMAQIALPYNESFASITAANGFPTVTGGAWTRTGTTTLQPTYITNQTSYNRSGNGDTYFICFRYSNTAGNYYLVGPFALTAGTSYNASILYKADGLSGFGPLALTYGTADTAAAQTNTIVSLPANITNTAFTKLAGDFTVSADGSYYIGIKCTSTSNPWYLTLDDFNLKLSPTCIEPTSLTASAITTSDATISWTAPSTAPANGYDLYVSTSSTAPTAATTPTYTGITGTSTTVSSLSPSTVYYVWARSNCSTTDVSAWSSVYSFTTSCVSISSFPWTENFDAMSTLGSNVLPPCWKSVPGGSSSSTYFTSAGSSGNTYNDPRSTPNYLTIFYPTTNAAYLFTPTYTLTAGQSYDFVFYWVGDGTTGWQGDVLVNNAQTATGATNLSTFITSSQTAPGGSNSTNYTKVKVSYVPPTTGDYNFGIKTLATSFSPNYLGFDDFSLGFSPTCVEPTSLTTSNITSSGADVSWTAPASAPANGYEVYVSSSSTAPTAATTPTYTGITGTSTTVSSLSPSTTYYVWARSVCSASDTSSWSNSTSFTTLCASVNLPYSENFESVTVPAIPACTSVQNVGTGNNWVTYALSSATFGFSAGKLLRYAYSSTNPANTWFYTKGLNLTAGTQYVIKYRAGSSDTAYTEKLKVAYGTSANNTAMTNVIADYPALIHANSTYDTYYFTPATTGVYYIGFNAYSDTDQAYLYVDDITVDVAPSCTLPGKPTFSGITQTDALVSWTASLSNPANGYDVYYSTSSTAPTAATTPTYEAVSGLSQALSGLSAGTTYFVWVRANCSTTDKSDWTDVAQFITTCPGSYNVPYTQDFESTIVPNIPNCTSTQNLSTANNWRTYFNGTATLTGNWLVCAYNASVASNAWFYTPGINLESGKHYKLTYNYVGGASGYTDKLKVAYGTSADSASMTTVLANHTALTSATTINNGSVSFVPPATGIYYFGFNAYSAADQNFVAVDNISIIEDTALATDTNIKTDLSIYPNPFADVIHISDIKNIKSVTITDATGRMVKQVNTISSSINLGNLKSGLYLIQLNYNDGSTNVQKLIKK